MKKRILSLVMALVLALGLLPMSVFATTYNETDQIVTVEKYDENGNGTFLLPPTRVTRKTTGYGNAWVPYAVGSENVTLQNDCITAYVDSSQADGWLNNGDIVSTSKWLASVNGTCYEDTCWFYAKEVNVLRIVFSPSGTGSEFQLSSPGWADLGTMAVNKDALIELLSRYAPGDFDEGSAAAAAYQAARNTVLNLSATAEDVADALETLDAAVQVPATGITLSPQALNLNAGDTATVTAALTPEGSTDTVTWSVADPSVATVDANGVVTGVAAGSTTLTARANDTVSASVNITVSGSAEPSTDPYVYFEYADGSTQQMAANGSFTLCSLDQGYFRVGNTTASAWWENEEVIDAGSGSVAYHWYVNRETGAWQPSGQQPTKPIVVTAGDFTKSFTINYKATSGITQLKTYVNGTEVTDDTPYEVTGCVSGVAVTTKGLKDGSWIDVPVQALNYDTSDNVYYNFRFVGNEMTINRAGNATMTVSLKGENVSTTFKAVCNPVQATAMKVVVPETPVEISDWDAHGFYVGLRPDTGYSIEFTPENATNRDVTWEALTPAIANHSDLHSAGIYPLKAGTAKFLVTNKENPSLKQEVTVTFTFRNPLTAAASSESSYTLTEGQAQELTISVTPESATEQRFDWTYSQDGVVEVSDEIKTSEDGLSHWTTHQIKALKAGTVTVTGTPWDQTGSCQPVTFTVTVGAGTPEPPAEADRSRIDTLMETIAASYVGESYEWVVMDMAAYADYNPSTTYTTSASARQSYIDSAIQSVTTEGAGDTTYSKAVIILQSIGADPQTLYPAGSSTSISAVQELNNVTHSSSAWCAPYTLFAYNQGEYGTDTYEQALIQEVLANQGEDGSWDEWGTIDTTANVIAALSLYDSDPQVASAIDKAVNYLSSQQKTDGTFDGGYGSNANSTAMVVIGLAAAGINPHTDNRFIQNGNSALDGLLSFALSDNSGFGYMDNTSSNALATEQGFRALIAASQVMDTGSAYNIYDFSGNTVSPAWETGSTTPTDPEEPATPADPDNTITVTVSIQADTGYWLRNKSVTVSEGSTVSVAFVQALEGTGITQVGAEAGYIRSITKNGVTLAEFTKGPNSGWLYTVNGKLPIVSVTACTLSDGDAILLYYTDDWTKDPNASGIDPADQAAADTVSGLIAAIGTVTKDSGDKIAAARAAYDKLTDIQKALVSNYHKLTAAETEYAALTAPAALPFTDVTGHWALDSIRKVYDLGLMTGTKATRFSPDTALNRAMLVTILYRLEGSPAVSSASTFTDVAAGTWYTDAVAWAAQHGITTGYGNGRFGPKDDITREQMAAILYRYAQYKTYDTAASADLSAYHDAGSISGWALEALQWANGAGLISGRSASLLVPVGSTTRAETAVILVRFLEQIVP